MKKLLVANRGEIARRVFRTAKMMGISTVAVYSDPDAEAPHVVDADEAVNLPGAAPTDTYLDIDAVLAAAHLTGADAIHPGYGFLSENEAFASACAEAGIVFVGPSPEAIAAMGSKIEAKRLMADAGVPVLPGVTLGADATADELAAALEVTGVPALVKAAFGGGGRGMRIVHHGSALAEEVTAARREAGAAFGDDTVFLERFVEHPRHVEVQVFGDSHGNVAHLFERECSIQRRYQKVIEEAPSPAVDDGLRAELCTAAVAAARAIDYVGAGTVEFVLADDGRFFFLEVNTRLQVEHPVTEMVTGVDLVEAQLRVARGEPLPVDLVAATLDGHAIEARLYAEDVAADYAPATGRIERLSFGWDDDVRVDSGYESGSMVSTYYDAMLAKVISHAATRDVAIDRLAGALVRADVHGPTTNRDLLVNVLRHDDFRAGRTDTGFLARHDCTTPLASLAVRRVHAVAAAIARQCEHRAGQTLPSGWRNVPTAYQRAEFTDVLVEYRFGRDGLDVLVDGDEIAARLASAELLSSGDDGGQVQVGLVVDDVRRLVQVHRVGAVSYVDDATCSSTLVDAERFPLPDDFADPGSLLAPMPGSVVRILGTVGDIVEAGDTIIVVEAMKMEHRIDCPTAGTIAAILVDVGEQVDTGTLLASVDDHDHDDDQDQSASPAPADREIETSGS
ncbi:MAG: biotin carboxylase N-terminal domain-containing protein [Acidimicrobiia bacterium]|nr:biotin carboxylase N-terminal domain-containing protein [Acidimicrobiia bacterium]